MGRLQLMEEECDCIEVIFQDYVQSRKTHKNFLFFEGKDDFKYYWCRISPFIGNQKYKKYICNCKNNVISIYDMIKNKTKINEEEKLLYFVDRDFDKELNLPEDIFITPTYAIENFYISDNALKNMLIGELGLSGESNDDDDKHDLEIAFKYLIDNRNKIIEQILYVNAWYSIQYRLTDLEQCPKLTAIKNYEAIKNIKSKEELESLVPNSVSVSDEMMTEEIKYLRENPVVRLRGKYFEQTIPYYIRKVFEDSNKKKNRTMLKKRRKVNINIGEDNMVCILSNYADVPNELITYLQNKFLRKEKCA
ncbi:MAG: DUF4435 domain-containing protein [Clostridiales bacterium]|nr:DUF4435 domain-containing protein [Clostridiales bacterium]